MVLAAKCLGVNFFFNDTATTEIYTLSLHDALPIYVAVNTNPRYTDTNAIAILTNATGSPLDRKSTRLNSSHSQISYAVFCLKKKIELNTLTKSQIWTVLLKA